MINTAQQQAASEFEALFRQAKQHHFSGRLHDAEIHYKRLQTDYPGSFDVLH